MTKLIMVVQDEGGAYMNYSQGELLQIMEESAALPPELARLMGKQWVSPEPSWNLYRC